ncbi:CheR family methyltransferase [Dendrosporobacter sp. 1207_IL3150]|uniref:CheR family methyltransferase n=1 Tax=Dendrosporobacter sp. 1207_IL3150 TaxID=3084054 RepID=UPI002FD8E392
MITITDNEFSQLTQYIHANYGIKLGPEKKALIVGRLGNLLVQKQFKNFSQYYEYILADKSGSADISLVNLITTNHTFFMRETDHFNYFRGTVLPYLKATIKDYDLRLWSAGCSSGEEPYTLAMIIDEFLGEEKNRWDRKLLATDLSSKVLDVAQKGIYSNESLAPLPTLFKQKYSRSTTTDTSEICHEIKNEIIFRKFNLMTKIFPFKKKFHVIFCRNVMIYFDSRTKNELIDKFYNLLENGGYLFIGHSESIARDQTRFKYVMPAVYRKEL